MPYLIAEYSFDPPLSDEQLSTDSRKLDSCLAQYGARWLCSYLSSDRRRMICQFEAPDADAVRSAMRSAGVKFERVWTADVYRLEDEKPQLEASRAAPAPLETSA